MSLLAAAAVGAPAIAAIASWIIRRRRPDQSKSPLPKAVSTRKQTSSLSKVPESNSSSQNLPQHLAKESESLLRLPSVANYMAPLSEANGTHPSTSADSASAVAAHIHSTSPLPDQYTRVGAQSGIPMARPPPSLPASPLRAPTSEPAVTAAMAPTTMNSPMPQQVSPAPAINVGAETKSAPFVYGNLSAEVCRSEFKVHSMALRPVSSLCFSSYCRTCLMMHVSTRCYALGPLSRRRRSARSKS